MNGIAHPDALAPRTSRNASAFQSPAFPPGLSSMIWALSRVIGRALSPMTAASCATCGGRAGGPTSLPQSVSGQTTSSRGTTRPANAGGLETSSCECIAGPLVLLAGHLCNPGIWDDAAKRHTSTLEETGSRCNTGLCSMSGRNSHGWPRRHPSQTCPCQKEQPAGRG